MSAIIDGLRALMNDRAVLLTKRVEIDAQVSLIDAQLAEVRHVLGEIEPTPHEKSCISRTTQLPCDCERAAHRQPDRVAIASPAAVAIALTDALMGEADRGFLGALGDGAQAQEEVALGARPARTPRVAEPTVCEAKGCGKTFTPRPGTAGRFCSRECYSAKATARRALDRPHRKKNVYQNAEIERIAAAAATGDPNPPAVKADERTIEDRDASVLDSIKRCGGVATIRDLRLRFPKTDPAAGNHVTADEALRNALSRLRSKGLIGRTGDAYSLVGAGSEIGRG